MEHAGVTPRGAVSAPDLAALFRRPGPFLTVYVNTPGDIANAAPQNTLRWKNLRDRAAEQGAPEEALEAVDAVVGDAHLFGQALAAVVDGAGDVLHRSHGDRTLDADLVRWAPLPSVATILDWRQAALPHVVVLADREGADITAVEASGGEISVEAGGNGYPIERNQPGGWSQRRYQERAHNAWDQNADDVAAKVTALVERTGARLVVVAGDVHAVQLLRASLPGEVTELVREVAGGRSADGSEDRVAEEVSRLVATAAAEESVNLLRKVREELGQGDRAAQGVPAVVDALRMAQVEVLLVPDDAGDEATLWYGPDAAHIATDAADLRALGVDDPAEGRRVDVLLRSAFGTGASVRVAPSAALREDVAAILRWS